MAVIVIPPWDLCGGPGLDPYSLDESGITRWRYSGVYGWRGTALVELESKVEPDPNRHDGRWGELAFMPHSTVPFDLVEHGEPRRAFVPAYPSVWDALMLEAAARAVARFEWRVGTVHERVACPRCGARVGERCVALRGRGVEGVVRRELKHPHRERLRADGIYER